MPTAPRPPSSPEPLELIPDHPRSVAGEDLAWVAAPADGHDPAAVLAAFLVVLHKYTGQAELLLDVELAGRSGALSVTVDPDATAARVLAGAEHGPCWQTPVRFADHPVLAMPDQDVDLVLSTYGAGLRVGYRVGLFEPGTAARLAEHVRRALRQRQSLSLIHI